MTYLRSANPSAYSPKRRSLPQGFDLGKILRIALFCVLFGTAPVGAQQVVVKELSLPQKADTDVVSVHTAWSVEYGRPGDELVLAVIFEIDEGYHINADPGQVVSFDDFKPIPTRIIVKAASDGVTIESPRFPKAETFKVDYASGDLMTFSGQTTAYLPMRLSETISAGVMRLNLEVTYQACDDKICLFPQTIIIDENISVLETARAPAAINRAFFSNYEAESAASRRVVNFDLFGWYFSFTVSSWTGLTVLLLTAAFGGLLLNFTPCVLPLIPIKIICLANAAENRRRCLALGLTMFLGVLVFWLGLGVSIALVSGFTATNQLFQYPAFTIGIGLIIAIMAFGMCGLFSVRLPQFIYMINPSQETLPGSFGLGILTAILSTPCTAPFMGAAAAWAATRNPLTTLATFAAIGIGMALPYLILSVFPSLVKKMPKSGPAGVLIKQVMGLFMLAAAAYFVGVGLSALLNVPPNPPSKLYWLVVMGLCAGAGGWLVYRTLRISTRRKVRFFFAGLGLLILVGSAYGSIQLTDPGPVAWVYYTPERFEDAMAADKIVVMVFTAEWCLNCKALEQGVLHGRRVSKLLAAGDVVPIKVDITGDNAAGKARLKQTGHLTIPLLVIYAPGGKEIFRGDFYTADQIQQAIESARIVQDSRTAAHGFLYRLPTAGLIVI